MQAGESGSVDERLGSESETCETNKGFVHCVLHTPYQTGGTRRIGVCNCLPVDLAVETEESHWTGGIYSCVNRLFDAFYTVLSVPLHKDAGGLLAVLDLR